LLTTGTREDELRQEYREVNITGQEVPSREFGPHAHGTLRNESHVNTEPDSYISKLKRTL
jgi:hypothetical protein